MSGSIQDITERKLAELNLKAALCEINELKEKVERGHIVRVLEQVNWKVSGQNGAAQILGRNRSTLRARIRKLGIRQP